MKTLPLASRTRVVGFKDTVSRMPWLLVTMAPTCLSLCSRVFLEPQQNLPPRAVNMKEVVAHTRRAKRMLCEQECAPPSTVNPHTGPYILLSFGKRTAKPQEARSLHRWHSSQSGTSFSGSKEHVLRSVITSVEVFLSPFLCDKSGMAPQPLDLGLEDIPKHVTALCSRLNASCLQARAAVKCLISRHNCLIWNEGCGDFQALAHRSFC